MLLTDKNKTNTSWSLTRSSVEGLARSIESGKPETFLSYLRTMARFPTYSARNVLLIAAQRPDATRLEGIRSWNELGRAVLPGEKGIYIFAPAVGYTTKKAASSDDSSSKAKPNKKATGKKSAEPATEAPQQEAHLLGFRGVYVFDIAQTGGGEVQEPRPQLDSQELVRRLLAFAESRQMTVEYSPRIAPAKATSYYGVIRLLPDVQAAETLPELLREVASQTLYATRRRTFVTRALHQQETKAAAFVVCEALGLDAKSHFADCQLYYGDAGLLRESLEIVHQTAAQILGAISPEVAANSAQEVRQ